MHRVGVGVGVDGNALDVHLPQGASDADGDLAAVRDQNASKRTMAPVFAHRHPALQRDVAVLLGGQGLALALEQAQPGGKPGARLGRHDHFVDVSARRGDVRIGESLLVLADEPLSLGR